MMKSIWYLIYNVIIVPALFLLIKIAGLFNSKIKRGVAGRKRLFEDLLLTAANLDKNKKLIWFHSSSLGEFEQAKPILEKLKKDFNINVLVTFFSPSGYDNSRKYPYADIVSYIPFDSVSQSKKFISIVRPDVAILMRYDIWPNHIWEMKKANIPYFLVDATMKKSSPRKIPIIKNFHRLLFKDFTRILTVSTEDEKGFKDFGCTDEQVTAVGDTRFDRVYQRSSLAHGMNLIKDDLLKDKKIFVVVSAWEQDEEVLIPAFKKLARFDKDVLLIIAPHEPTVLHLEKIEHEFTGELATIRFSSMNNYMGEHIIIVDSIGILLTLYTYAHAAFVGGSFKQGIHNVLEAAVYGIPVLFGPKIDNSQETRELLKRGGGILIKNKRDAFKQLRILFSNENVRKEKGNISFNYVQENLGATDKIIKEISSYM
ncbi:MAG: 3-deoxy-D-manno-octulosonic acid transferase [Ignavibacteriaceae bacterium]|nr:3-deoxy-D-manno-octulosonic acid transferase [Ignavibacteriaceae bacterium]